MCSMLQVNGLFSVLQIFVLFHELYMIYVVGFGIMHCMLCYRCCYHGLYDVLQVSWVIWCDVDVGNIVYIVSYILLCVVGIDIMSYIMYVVGFGIMSYMVCCRYHGLYGVMQMLVTLVIYGIIHSVLCCRYWYHELYNVCCRFWYRVLYGVLYGQV